MTPDGALAGSQLWILKGEQSGLLTRIAARKYLILSYAIALTRASSVVIHRAANNFERDICASHQ